MGQNGSESKVKETCYKIRWLKNIKIMLVSYMHHDQLEHEKFVSTPSKVFFNDISTLKWLFCELSQMVVMQNGSVRNFLINPFLQLI